MGFEWPLNTCLTVHYSAHMLFAYLRLTISLDFSRDLRILKIFSVTIVLECQTAWIPMRRRDTRRLIGIQAVWKYHHSFFRSTHICQNLRIFHDPVLVTLYRYTVLLLSWKPTSDNSHMYQYNQRSRHTLAFINIFLSNKSMLYINQFNVYRHWYW